MTVRSPVAITIDAPSSWDIASTWPVHSGSVLRAAPSEVLDTSPSESISHFSVGLAAFLSLTRAKSMPVLGPPSGTLWKYSGT